MSPRDVLARHFEPTKVGIGQARLRGQTYEPPALVADAHPADEFVLQAFNGVRVFACRLQALGEELVDGNLPERGARARRYTGLRSQLVPSPRLVAGAKRFPRLARKRLARREAEIKRPIDVMDEIKERVGGGRQQPRLRLRLS